jgi:hypothetical protein
LSRGNTRAGRMMALADRGSQMALFGTNSEKRD